jgi:two-component system, response regulator
MKNYKAVDILIVEDNQTDVELTVRALKKQSLVNEIQVVNDGEEALDFLFLRGKYAKRAFCDRLKVVFLDLKLPKISGLEVLRALKTNEQTKNLPVVMITSSKEDPDIKAAYELGVNSYVVKPVNFEDFISAIQNIGLYWLLVNETPEIKNI